MKTDEKFVQELIKKTKKARSRRKKRKILTTCACIGLLAFFVGFSNILNF